MEVDQNSVNDHTQSESVGLFIVASQSSSYDDAKYLLSQLNISLSQIGDRLGSFKNDMLNSIRAHQFEQTSIDQQYIISYSDEGLFHFDFLVNTNQSKFKQLFKLFLQANIKEKFLINLTFDSNHNGDMNLNDSVITCDDIQSMLALYPSRINLILNQKVLDSNKNWKLLEKIQNVTVKSIHSLLNQNPNQFDEFVQLTERYFNHSPVDQLMETPVCTGTLKIQKPSIYIFPASQGDSCYFAINGYSMLINGGYDRLRPCFWKFVNMLQQIDSVLITHTDSDSLGGLSTFFQKKQINPDIKPSVLTVLGNLIGSQYTHNLHSSPSKSAANLIINELPNCTGNKSDTDLILEAIDRLQIKLQPLFIQRPITEKVKQHSEHVRLYSKLGYGNLDLYVLAPYSNSSEFKDFCVQQQSLISKTHKAQLAVQQVYRNLPVSHLASSVCLLVWQPCYRSDSTNTAVRLLFTGNCPQNVLFSALDKLKDFDILNQAVYKVKSDLDQYTQFQNMIKKETKVVKESKELSSNKLNTSISKSNGNEALKSSGSDKKVETKTNGSTVHKQAALKPPKPASVNGNSTINNSSIKKADTSMSKDKPAEKKTAPVMPRQSLSSAKTEKLPVKQSNSDTNAIKSTPKTTAVKPPTKQIVSKQTINKVEPLKKNSKTNPAPVKKDTKSSKTLSLSVDQTHVPDSQPKAEITPVQPVEHIVQHNEQVVVEENFYNNLVYVESEANGENNETEQLEHVEQVEVVEQVEIVEHEQEIVETEHVQSEDNNITNEPIQEEVHLTEELIETEPTVENLEHEQQVLDQGTDNIETLDEEQAEYEPTEEHSEPFDEGIHQEEDFQKFDNQVEENQGEKVDIEKISDENLPIEESDEENKNEVVEDGLPVEPSINHEVVTTYDVNIVDVNVENVTLAKADVVIENIDSEEKGEPVYSNESPNLSPVKKDFSPLNGQDEIAIDHTTAPIIEEQLSNQNGTLEANTDEIVSGNIENNEARCQDDIMTRSFIEDSVDPDSNPFKPVKKLEESCDLNRTHELFQDEESSNTSKTEDYNLILNGVDGLKIENGHHHEEVNLLELPKPVNPEQVGLTLKSTPNGKKLNQPVSPSQNSDLKSINKNNSSNSVQKGMKSIPIHPIYLELVYIPAHGNSSYVDIEFFKRVRARHYVLSAVDFSEQVLNSLVDGKETWEDKNLQVTLIPTYESDVLRRWFENNQERLARLKIDITPAARHSTITIDENPDLSCQVYKLEF